MTTSATDQVMGKIDLEERIIGGGMRPQKGARKFAILRVSKLSGMGKVAAAAQHNFRERETPNADPERLDANTVIDGARNTEDLLKRWHNLAPEKIRKNAVHALEYVVTASPEKLEEMGAKNQDAYFEDALNWLREKHGAENILSAVVHRDEISPHLQVLVIPLDERGKLNARALVGGKPQMRQMQTDFAKVVGERHGLDRGIERSNANHETIRSYYARATGKRKVSFKMPERKEAGFLGRGGETDAEWSERVSEAVEGALRAAQARADEHSLDAARSAVVASEALSERDTINQGLTILYALHHTRHETGHWDEVGMTALKLYRQLYDQMPEAAQMVCDDLVSEMSEPTVPEQREEAERLEQERQRELQRAQQELQRTREAEREQQRARAIERKTIERDDDYGLDFD